MEPDQIRTSLLSSVEVLASPAARQCAYLSDLGERIGVHFGTNVDELALEFDAYYAPAAPIMDELGWSGAVEEALVVLGAQLDSMSGPTHASLWTTDALASAPEWAKVRHVAAIALEAAR
jgi:hypothetical protein